MADKDREATEWTGHDLYDADGDKIGTVTDVRYGDFTLGLKWLVVKTGVLGTKKVLVPANDVQHSGDRLVVSIDKDVIDKAPAVDSDEAVFPTEEGKLCNYYGLDYASGIGQPDEGCQEKGDERPATAADLAAAAKVEPPEPPAERW